MKIGIPLSRHAYTPESYAYERYLTSKGWSVQLDYNLDPNNDINLFFMGIRPFWKKVQGRAKEIHEYQSLSTPPYAHLKNLTKKIINRKPDGRIFLNNFVYQNFNFSDDVDYIYRDMGVDDSLFQKPNDNPKYDILYCGSISGRVGLLETILNLAKSYKIILVGKVTREEEVLLKDKNITLAGFVSREKLPDIYRDARFGLNYTPDIYPFNIQTSTKTLEYLASGLGIISNRYYWSENFFKSIGYNPVWIEEGKIENSFGKSENHTLNLEKFSWENILNTSKFDDFIVSVLSD